MASMTIESQRDLRKSLVETQPVQYSIGVGVHGGH